MIITDSKTQEEMSTTFQIINIHILNYKHPNFNPTLFCKIHLICVSIMEGARNIKVGGSRKAYSGMYSAVPRRFSRVQLSVTLWTVTHQAPLSMGFSRQEYWGGLPYPPPGHLPHPGI